MCTQKKRKKKHQKHSIISRLAYLKREEEMISIFLFTVCIESIVEYSIHDSNNFEIQKQALKNLHQGVASMYRIATILFLAKMMTSICTLKVERLKLSQKSIFHVFVLVSGTLYVQHASLSLMFAHLSKKWTLSFHNPRFWVLVLKYSSYNAVFV